MAATATVTTQAIKDNLSLVKQYAPNTRIVAMVKAYGYGHGFAKVIPALSQADLLAVANRAELLQLRRYSQQSVLLLSNCDDIDDLRFFYQQNCQIVIHTMAQFERIKMAKVPLNVWLKVDTGMHRLGLPAKNISALINELRQNTHINLVALMSHFACADEPEHHFNQQQLNTFNALTDCTIERSLSNSAAILSMPQAHFQWVRPGIMLYGISPFSAPIDDLKPAMRLSAPVIDVKPISQGDGIGYGLTWQCKENCHIATIAIGYGDGYPRHCANNTPVLIGDQCYPLAGRVSMDYITVQVDGKKVAIGDEAVLWGDTRLRIEKVAQCANTIGYQLVSQLTSRVLFV